MKSAVAVFFVLLMSSAAFTQDDDRFKRIVERIEKEIRESHERTREEIRAIIRAELQKTPGKTPAAPAPARKVTLGISADDLTEADRKALGGETGIRVAAVRGPAKEAGIQPGDLLVEFDGQPVTEEKLGDLLSKRKPGETVTAVVMRAGKRLPVKIILAERKD